MPVATAPPGRIHDNVLSLVGNSPLVRLDKIAKEEGLRCNLLAKVEGYNAGGSVKVSRYSSDWVYMVQPARHSRSY